MVLSKNAQTGLAVAAKELAMSQTDWGKHNLLYIYEDPT
jgi:hypothetical protein